ncbi:hypothetical protein [Noviherbaspirillum sedimenti]|uniref:Uncharacterized protein n=1 Tax=Noviherbaspirillum sedimenti TaxID=2320865 RepID=A0A3A3G676_9BURK|nr:hypothetical protein [Noviherbaspirillum sedimenti]RJG02032.1 hypothetical protein D3878_10950 [Noviherbaspirillum sedimenti]
MMNRQQLFNLMNEAGFSTDWVGYGDVQETLAKYEKFAELIEDKLMTRPAFRSESNADKHL